MPWFSFQRKENYPTRYLDQHSSASVDVLTSGLILAFVILGVSFLSLLPSYKGKRRYAFFFQVIITLIIGGIVVVVNFGQNWEVGHVTITSPYKAGSPGEIKANLGIHIGLRGINITLNKADPNYVHSKGHFEHEDINYNEYFSWEGTQGRFGFGYYAARIAREFREATYRGIPIPILQLAEYFTFDGEGIRFGRHYRIAGWYSHILLWTAFPCWLIASILVSVVVRHGALFLMATGVFQLLSVAVWYFNRNFVELQVPYESMSDEVILKTKFGIDFYLVFGNAIFCISLGLVIYALNALYPDTMCGFFGIDPLSLYDEYHLTQDELAKGGKAETKNITHAPNANQMERGGAEELNAVVRRRSDDHGKFVLKRKVDVASRIFQKSFKGNSSILQHWKGIRLSHRARNMEEVNEINALTPLLPNRSDGDGLPLNDLGTNRETSDFPLTPPPLPSRNRKVTKNDK